MPKTEAVPLRPKTWECWSEAERDAYEETGRIGVKLSDVRKRVEVVAGWDLANKVETVTSELWLAELELRFARLKRYLQHLSDLLDFASDLVDVPERQELWRPYPGG